MEQHQVTVGAAEMAVIASSGKPTKERKPEPRMSLSSAIEQVLSEKPGDKRDIFRRAGELVGKNINHRSLATILSLKSEQGKIHRIGRIWHYGPKPVVPPAPVEHAPLRAARKKADPSKAVRESILDALTDCPMNSIEITEHLHASGYKIENKEVVQHLAALRNTGKARHGHGQDLNWYSMVAPSPVQAEELR